MHNTKASIENIKLTLADSSSTVVHFATGTGENLARSKNHKPLLWPAFVDLFRTPRRMRVTTAQYAALSPDDRKPHKSGPWFLRTTTIGNRRNADSLHPGVLLALDLDDATPALVADLRANLVLCGIAWFAHSTASSTPDKPKLRMVILLSRPVTPAEFEALARRVALGDPDLEQAVDKVSANAAQMMFLPTAPADGDFIFAESSGAPLDVDEMLAGWDGTRASLPRFPKEARLRERVAKAPDPREKAGVIGAFCRAYDVHDAIEAFSLPYDGEGDRMTYRHGHGSEGAVIHDNGLFMYSEHGSDPCYHELTNAWDLTRIHKYGDLDTGTEPGTPVQKLPSFKAMMKMAREDTKVAAELQAEKAATLEAFADIPPAGNDDDPEIAALLGFDPGGADLVPTVQRSAARKAADQNAVFSDTWAGAAHADRLRGQRLYVSATAQWLTFTGERWTAQTAEETMNDAKETSGAIYDAVARAVRDDPSDSNRAMLRRAIALHGSMPALGRMVEMARSEPGMHVPSPALFDLNPDTLTCPNCLLDLRTGALRPVGAGDLVAKLAGARFDPEARAPTFETFLEAALPDPEIRAFVQRAAGYTLTGSVDEEVYFMAYGVGANGKSVFANILQAVLGEYAGSFGAALVTKNRNENEAERMMARMPGLRLALVNETAQGDVFDDFRIKSLSSRERVSARKLYAEGFDFMPTGKIWIRTNNLPGVMDASEGFWRRCILIPFTTQVPEEKRIPDLDRRIIAEELPGVLNWALAGAMEWYRTGLLVPKVIKNEVRQYQKDTDVLGEWLEEHTERDINATAKVADAYSSYHFFMRDAGLKPLVRNAFGRALASRGIRQASGRANGRQYEGIRLLNGPLL